MKPLILSNQLKREQVQTDLQLQRINLIALITLTTLIICMLIPLIAFAVALAALAVSFRIAFRIRR